MSILRLQLFRAAQLRREVVEREAALYGPRFADTIFLRKRGFAVHVENTSVGRRFRLGNRQVSGTALRAVAARERRLLKQARKGN